MNFTRKSDAERFSTVTLDLSLSTPPRLVSGGSVRAAGWGWRHAGRRRFAVRDLNLTIDPGERVLLLGPSGAGKSTVLSAIAGVLGGSDEGEQEGSLCVDGMRPVDARGRVGLVLQDPDSQIVLARVGDDVAFSCENLGVPRHEIWPRVRQALDDVGLDVPLDAPTSALSGGQKQRLALAGMLAMQPRIILLDEPTANLDPSGVREVHDAVCRIYDRTGATLVIIEHRVTVWRDAVDRVLVLDDSGDVLADGPVEGVLETQAKTLRSSGVWVPGSPPFTTVRSSRADRNGSCGGDSLVMAADLSVGRKGENPTVTGVDLAIRAGEAFAITGPNGVGKSTLALTLAGLMRPISGSVCVSDTLANGVGSEPIRWSSRVLLERIGTVFQNPEHQFVSSTVRDELAVGPRALQLSAAAVTVRVDELLQRLRLDRLAGANPFTLSGGEKRRLSVATALATRPGLLVVDEPTFGQDSRTWCEIVRLLGELVLDGTTVVAVTHDTGLVGALCDREFQITNSGDSVLADVPLSENCDGAE